MLFSDLTIQPYHTYKFVIRIYTDYYSDSNLENKTNLLKTFPKKISLEFAFEQLTGIHSIACKRCHPKSMNHKQ